jgi:acetyl esterase
VTIVNAAPSSRYGARLNLDTAVQAFLDANPPESLEFLTVAEQRQLMRHLSDVNYLRFGRRAERVESVTDHEVAVHGGRIRVRMYRPGASDRLPVHVFLHGGGWWLGSIDEYVNEAICRYRCVHAHCVVAAVDYRLAPEHPFPTAINDICAVLRWINGEANALAVEPGMLSIGGVSAGGNLAAAVTLNVRDEGGPALVFQLLEVPAFDLTGALMQAALATEDLRPLADRAAEFTTATRLYLSDPQQAMLPLASPGHADDLSGLPPAQILTAELDPLRDEGEDYARRLAAAGVPAAVKRWPGAIHATSFLTRAWPSAQAWQHAAAAAIRDAHQQAAAHPAAKCRQSW